MQLSLLQSASKVFSLAEGSIVCASQPCRQTCALAPPPYMRNPPPPPSRQRIAADTIEYKHDAATGQNTTRYSSGAFVRPGSCFSSDAGELAPKLEYPNFAESPFQSFVCATKRRFTAVHVLTCAHCFAASAPTAPKAPGLLQPLSSLRSTARFAMRRGLMPRIIKSKATSMSCRSTRTTASALNVGACVVLDLVLVGGDRWWRWCLCCCRWPAYRGRALTPRQAARGYGLQGQESAVP